MPILKPLALFTDWDEGNLNTLDHREKRAKTIQQSMDRWGPPEYPERPPTEVTDEQLVTWQRLINHGDKLPKADRETWSLFVTWRMAVIKKESQASGNLLVILSSIQAIELSGKEASTLRTFMIDAYGWERGLPSPILDVHIWKLKDRMSQNLTLLPRHLRDASNAPKPEPPSEPPQGRLGYSETDAYGDPHED